LTSGRISTDDRSTGRLVRLQRKSCTGGAGKGICESVIKLSIKTGHNTMGLERKQQPEGNI